MRIQRFLVSRPLWLALLALLASSLRAAHADSSCLTDGFLPPNSLKIEVSEAHPFGFNGITEQKFNELLSKVENYYRPIVAKKGASLLFLRYWTDGTVNAYADRSGNQWYVRMFGGLARHHAITEDGLTLVACHEMGHHLGGAPKYSSHWAANEGQADYFATLKCLRNIFQNDNNVDIVKAMRVDPTITKSCEAAFSDAASIALCERSTMAGQSSAELMRALAGSGPINVNTPDPTLVSSTYDMHPAAQCRLDTYFSGAICQVGQTEPLSEFDPTVGTCSIEKNFKVGVRPQCWYKPMGT